MKCKKFIILLGCIVFLIFTLTACSLFGEEDDKNKQENEAVSEESTEICSSELGTEVSGIIDVIGTEVTDGSSSTMGNYAEDDSAVVDSSDEYKRCYDKNRDGLVSEAEIKVYDKYFYAATPTSEAEKKVLLAGYYTTVDLGDGRYAVMVKNKPVSEFEVAIEILDETLLKKGYAAGEFTMSTLDEERDMVLCEKVPIYCSVAKMCPEVTNTSFNEKAYEKVFGYKNAALLCSRYVKYGFNNSGFGTIQGQDIKFNADEVLAICKYMTNKNPADYLDSCPYPINKVYREISDDGSRVTYNFTVDVYADYTLIDKLEEEIKNTAAKEYPGYVFSYDRGSIFTEDYIEGRFETRFLLVSASTDNCHLTCNQIGQTLKQSYSGYVNINRIDSVEGIFNSYSFSEVRLTINIRMSFVVIDPNNGEFMTCTYKIFNSAGECVIDHENHFSLNEGLLTKDYILPPDEYTIVFYDIEM